MKKISKKLLSVLMILMIIVTIIPSGTITASATSGSDIVNYARQFVGYPYVSYTHGPNTFDCSGFVYYVFKNFGITLPLVTSAYWNNPTAYGTVVGHGSTENAQIGDVISWQGHVAIYTGNGYCIQALNPDFDVTDKIKVNAFQKAPGVPDLNYNVIRIYGIGEPYLDVNAKVDGSDTHNIEGIATVDVYVNGSLEADDVTDFYLQFKKGTTYEIKDLKITGCYALAGAESFSGILDSDKDCRFEFVTQHTLNDGVITTQPTCTEVGVKTVSCANCNYTSTADVDPLGHDYVETRIPPTCTENAKYVGICSRCNDSVVRAVEEEDVWSDWSTEMPDTDASRIETKTQYRYMGTETKVTNEAELVGWTLVDQYWSEGENSTFEYVTSFPAGFSTNNALYQKYNKTPPVSSENDTKKVVVGNATTAGYIYWHWCSSYYNGNSPINRLINDYYTGWDAGSSRPYDVFHAFYSTEYKNITPSSGAVDFYNANACNQTYWWNPAVSVMSVPVTTYEMMYEYTKETEWGEWTDEAPSGSDDKYETREVYRYSDSTDLAGHKWDNGTTVNDITTYTCSVCGETKTGDLNAPENTTKPEDTTKPEESTKPIESDGDFSIIVPSKISVGDTFDVILHNKNMTGTTSGDLLFTYDSDLLEFVSIREGKDANFYMYSGNDLGNGNIAWAFLYMGAAPSASTDIVVLTFTALQEGTSAIDVDVTSWEGKAAPAAATFNISVKEQSSEAPEETTKPEESTNPEETTKPEKPTTPIESDGDFSILVPSDIIVGDTFDVILHNKDMTGTGSGDLLFTYDSDLLEFVSIRESEDANFYMCNGGDIGNGNITWTFFYLDDEPAASTDLVVLTFTALQTGTAAIDVDVTSWEGKATPAAATFNISVKEHSSEAPEETTKPEETTRPEETTPPEDITTPSYMEGDVNGDGEITASDARIVLRVSAELDTLEGDLLLAADANKDSEITASDARKILRVSAELDTF